MGLGKEFYGSFDSIGLKNTSTFNFKGNKSTVQMSSGFSGGSSLSGQTPLMAPTPAFVSTSGETDPRGCLTTMWPAVGHLFREGTVLTSGWLFDTSPGQLTPLCWEALGLASDHVPSSLLTVSTEVSHVLGTAILGTRDEDALPRGDIQAEGPHLPRVIRVFRGARSESCWLRSEKCRIPGSGSASRAPCRETVGRVRGAGLPLLPVPTHTVTRTQRELDGP